MSERWDSHKFLSSSPLAGSIVASTPPDLAETFRHGGWMQFRRRVDEALSVSPVVTPRRLSAFRLCGADACVEVTRHHITGEVNGARIRSTKCHDRFCVPCANERSFRIRSNLLNHMHGRKNLSLVTLTLKSEDQPLRYTLNRITRCFRKLRNGKIWKKYIEGGAAIIETKVGAGSGLWHVHFHVVCEAKYIPQKLLSDEWLKITGDSHVVDIRRVGARTGAVQYITKYVTKAADSSVVNSRRHLLEAIDAFTGRRLVTTFGTWRGLKLMENVTDEVIEGSTTAWTNVGPLSAIIAGAAVLGSEEFKILRLLKRSRPPPPS
ncbi:MAG: protein rep [Phycisphaerae bacterium]